MMAQNLTAFEHAINPELRLNINGHKPIVLWFTGLSGSGKSSIAGRLETKLVTDYQAHTCFLDGDSLRQGLNSDLGFSARDRSENIRRAGEVAKLMYAAGLIVLVSFISPFSVDRDRAKSLFPENGFWEIFVDCPIEICQNRDSKQLYQRAQSGEIPGFTGVSSPYEVPVHPDMILHSDQCSIEECADLVLKRLIQAGLLKQNKNSPDKDR
ncbi:MAG: adenylyl-sulfate kinase [Anaerolineaceae bacterium]